jgi:hypothetical protein
MFSKWGLSVRVAFALALTLLLITFAVAAKEFVAPKVYPAKTYPALDEHPMEKAGIAADPYDLPEKYAIFSVRYLEHGFMPINLVVTNDSDQPLVLTDMQVQLVTRDRTKISPADDDDVYRRITRMNRSGGQSPAPRIPIPLPKSKDKQGIPKEAYGELESAKFKARAVEPGGTQAGFFFFDVGNMRNPLAGAHLYITGLKDNNGNELMYFEIPLEKYLSYTPPTNPTTTQTPAPSPK